MLTTWNASERTALIEELFGGELDDLSDVGDNESDSTSEEPTPLLVPAAPCQRTRAKNVRAPPRASAAPSRSVLPGCQRSRSTKTLPVHSFVPTRIESTSLHNILSTSIPLTSTPVKDRLSSQDATPLPSSRKRKHHDNEGEQRRRKHRKREIRKARRAAESRPRAMRDIWMKHLLNAQPVILPHFDITSLPVAPSGFCGCQRPSQNTTFTISQLQRLNFEIFRTSGDITYAFLDKNHQLFMLLCKRDASEEGLRRQERMTVALEKAREAATLTPERRGSFGVLRDGHIHSGGTWVRIILVAMFFVLIDIPGAQPRRQQCHEQPGLV